MPPNIGPALVVDGQAVDELAPGMAGHVSLDQVVDKWRHTFTCPIADALGGPLTGLAKAIGVTALFVDGLNPFVGLSSEQILALPNTVTKEIALTDSDAGENKTFEYNVMSYSIPQAFAVICLDNG